MRVSFLGLPDPRHEGATVLLNIGTTHPMTQLHIPVRAETSPAALQEPLISHPETSMHLFTLNL